MTKRRELAPARPRKRPHTQRARRQRFLLFCEGEATEPDYFTGFARFLRSPLIEVEIAPERRKDPIRLVELAAERREVAAREAKRARDESLTYDEVWCVFDGEEHPRLAEAIDLATSLEIGLAVSNPSFELWLLLHFQDQFSAIGAKGAYRAVRRYIANYDKHVDFARVEGHGSAAIGRAMKMEAIARDNGRWFDNPTSSVWQVVVRLCEESKVPSDQI